MTEHETLLAPEMEHLLREVASRPRSLFLRADRKTAFRAVRSRTVEPVSAMALSDALERELVQVHRAELAEVCRQACRTRLLEGEREKMFIMRYRGVNERVDPVPLMDVKKRLDGAVRSGVAEPWSGAIAAIQQALAPEDPEQVSVLDLAALGQRLVPGDGWRVNCGLWYLANRQHDSAEQLAKSVLDGWPETDRALRALEILAITSSEFGDCARAFAHQNLACGMREDYPVGQVNRFGYALMLGREVDALDAANQLERLVGAEHAVVSGLADANAERRQRGEWKASELAQATARRLAPRIGAAGRRLASAF